MAGAGDVCGGVAVTHRAPRAVLGWWWPGHPVLAVTASLSPCGHSQRGEEQGVQMGWHRGTQTGSPNPTGTPTRPAVTLASWHPVPHTSERCPQPVRPCAPCREWGIDGAGKCPAPRRGASTPRAARAGDAASPPPQPRGPHRRLHLTCTKSVAGDRDAPSLESRWMWRYPGDRAGLSGRRGAVPPQTPAAGRGRPPTFPHAGQGQGELPHEVVAGGAVVVLHHEAHQRQLGCLQLEGQRLLPARVEACGTVSGWARPPWPPATPGMGPAHHAATVLAPTGFGSLVARVSPQGGVWGEWGNGGGTGGGMLGHTGRNGVHTGVYWKE